MAEYVTLDVSTVRVIQLCVFVNTVNMKIKAHNELNSVCYVVCRCCRHEDTGVCGSYTKLYIE